MQTSNNLNNTFGLGAGVTPHFAITYESSLSQADGVDRANALMADCDADFDWMQTQFGGIALGSPFTEPEHLQILAGAWAGASWGPDNTPIGLTPGNGSTLDLVRYLVVSEVTERFMQTKANGWGYSFGDGNEGSKGEGLSRLLGFKFIVDKGLDPTIVTNGGATFLVSNAWLGSTRADFVNNNPDDNSPDPTTGCTTLFLYYLLHQLSFDITTIINNGGQTLGDAYRSLTGDIGDPFPFFKRLMDNAFPGTATITTGPNFDDPFPVGILSFWVNKSDFGRDEVQDSIDTSGGIFSNAFYLVLEGFSINSFNALGITVPTPTAGFAGLDGVHVQPSPATPGDPPPDSAIAQFEDPGNANIPQRIRFSFDVRFDNLNALPGVGGMPTTHELDAAAEVAGNALTGASARTIFELLPGEDPYFTNIDPSNAADVFYLSEDLRVFSAAVGDTPLGSPPITADPYASIQALLGHLNGTAAYTQPSTPDPLNNLPGQVGYETGDSSVTPENAAHQQNYNFAIARVRLKGAHNAQAVGVRVFFRLFVAQSCDTDFQPSTTYLSTLGTAGVDAGHPVFPLASGTGLIDPSGQSLRTVPFFATDGSGTHDYDGTVMNGNIRTITIPAAADDIWAYFGCFLDVYDSNNNSRFAGTHHCIVAEIAYSQAPIPTSTPTGATPSPASSDKLAQRNLQITLSENPKSPATHRIPQTFDLRPSHPFVGTPGSALAWPDELMIDWGNTPGGSEALIYWPQIQASEVLQLANELYSTHLLHHVDAHTIGCRVVRGVTYIPIPPATPGTTFAGLLTVNLPASVRKRETFNIVVRRLANRRFAEKRAARFAPNELAKAPKAEADQFTHLSSQTLNWRQVAGAFQVKIPVTTKAEMLPIEERVLAIIRWRLEEMSHLNRWRPVLERYLKLIEARVVGLGGDPSKTPESVKPLISGDLHPGRGKGKGRNKGTEGRREKHRRDDDDDDRENEHDDEKRQRKRP
jgi:hypothetical protein